MAEKEKQSSEKKELSPEKREQLAADIKLLEQIVKDILQWRYAVRANTSEDYRKEAPKNLKLTSQTGKEAEEMYQAAFSALETMLERIARLNQAPETERRKLAEWGSDFIRRNYLELNPETKKPFTLGEVLAQESPDDEPVAAWLAEKYDTEATEVQKMLTGSSLEQLRQQIDR